MKSKPILAKALLEYYIVSTGLPGSG